MSDKAKAQEKQTPEEFSLKTFMKSNIEIRKLLTMQETNGTVLLNESVSVVLHLRNLESHHCFKKKHFIS